MFNQAFIDKFHKEEKNIEWKNKPNKVTRQIQTEEIPQDD